MLLKFDCCVDQRYADSLFKQRTGPSEHLLKLSVSLETVVTDTLGTLDTKICLETKICLQSCPRCSFHISSMYFFTVRYMDLFAKNTSKLSYMFVNASFSHQQKSNDVNYA